MENFDKIYQKLANEDVYTTKLNCLIESLNSNEEIFNKLGDFISLVIGTSFEKVKLSSKECGLPEER
jgi:hypothetical protein